MWTWLTSLISGYVTWSSQYVASEGAMWTNMPSIVCCGAVVGAAIGCRLSIRNLENDKSRSLWGFVGHVLPGVFVFGLAGAVVAWLVSAFLPILLGAVTIFLAAASLVAPTYYYPRIVRIAKSVGNRVIATSGRWYRACRRKFAWRRKPADYLRELDHSAQEVQRRLRELIDQRETVRRHAEKCAQGISEAQRIRGGLQEGSAAADIAFDVVMKFEKKLRLAESQLAQIALVIPRIQQGQEEMSLLISLARLCRESGEDDIAEDSRAIEAARKALDALRKAFEQADAVLSVAVVEADMDIGLAFRQADEALRRNVRLGDPLDHVSQPVPVRVKA